MAAEDNARPAVKGDVLFIPRRPQVVVPKGSNMTENPFKLFSLPTYPVTAAEQTIFLRLLSRLPHMIDNMKLVRSWPYIPPKDRAKLADVHPEDLIKWVRTNIDVPAPRTGRRPDFGEQYKIQQDTNRSNFPPLFEG